ncbi:MAG: type II toxin-antitoxin system VapC family toxin [Stigonema ocellatum SAG 48.90 = DSM 106950]|nr:type II toxin-antitoxin system VapC family toxin [Stigonema ocellatum SAG 48.90 = DSM 106950]
MFLCDTNIISELARPEPNVGVVTWATGVSQMALSVITLEEIFYGLAAKPSPRIQSWFDLFFNSQCIIFPINEAVAKRAGELRGILRTQGKSRTQADMLIAATAQIHQLTLVTRNTRDFEGCGIPLLNPFRD